MERERLERERLVREKRAKSMPEGRRHGQVAMPHGGAAGHVYPRCRQAKRLVAYFNPFHTARTGPLILGVFSRYHDLVPCLAVC